MSIKTMFAMTASKGSGGGCVSYMRHPVEKSLFDHYDAFQAPFAGTDVLYSQHKDLFSPYSRKSSIPVVSLQKLIRERLW